MHSYHSKSTRGGYSEESKCTFTKISQSPFCKDINNIKKINIDTFDIDQTNYMNKETHDNQTKHLNMSTPTYLMVIKYICYSKCFSKVVT